MLSIAFTGLDHIDMEECKRRGIIVNNAAGYSTEAVAEEAICMMIGLYRHVIENDKITRACLGSSIAPGKEIANKTVGIIGLGAIGQRTAKLAQAFGCKVIAWNRTPKEIEGITIVDDIHYVQRGYERFEEKMQGLGAKMERVDNVKDLQLFKYREG